MNRRPSFVVLARGVFVPMAMACVTTVCVGLGLLHEAARVVRRAEDVRAKVDRLAEEIVAEAATMEAAATGSASSASQVGDREVRVVRSVGGWTTSVASGGGPPRWFGFNLVPGAANPAFGSACTVTRPDLKDWLREARCVATHELPRLAPDALAAAMVVDRSDLCAQDPGLALATWSVGTEGMDYVFLRAAGDVLANGGLVCVPGHLWIPPSAEPWTVRLARDVVVAVRGNLYVGGSVRVLGEGRLVFYVEPPPGSCAYGDRNGDGLWSAGDRLVADGGNFHGPLEGGGSAFLGLPGIHRAIQCDAGLVVHGELHLRAPATVAGPLVLGGGVTQNSADGRIVASGARHFLPEREVVPGMQVAGEPRPGRLRELDRNQPGMRQQALYQAAPSR
ncbi:MAG: hypothetical protein ACK501_01470 [Planctomycetota bacterium]